MNDILDQMQFEADPLADGSVAKIVGEWKDTSPETMKAKLRLLEESIRLLKPLNSNRALAEYDFSKASTPELREALTEFVRDAQILPPWADLEKIKRAEKIFNDNGVMACVLFFCASLPEVYVVPDISVVLRSTGHLERATENRIRTTATMILTVMLEGGLHRPEGGGVAQVMKARFVHAALRHMLMRGNPRDAAQAADVVEPLNGREGARHMYELLFTHGWNVKRDGLPCNQEELAYTLLTFSYVFLRSLRRLGLGLSKEDEEAYLHCWNVVGYLMGIRRDLMATTMTGAEALFEIMQERGREKPIENDPRPSLGRALVAAIESSIPVKPLKPLAALITQFLCSERTARDLGIDRSFTDRAKRSFDVTMFLGHMSDSTVQLAIHDFSLRRFILRIVGYRLLSTVLTDPTQPLDLPPNLLQQVNKMLDDWSHDPKAPAWLNALEDRFTARGSWQQSIGI